MAFIQNLFTSRDNSANASTYVGQQGRIWWDPLTNSMYYSDGSTPGGIPIGAGGNPFNQLLNTYNDVTFNSVNVTSNLSAGNVTVTGNLNLSNTSVANLGNFTIYDQTLSGTVQNRDVTIKSLGTGSIDIIGAFNVHGDGNIANTPSFLAQSDGQVRVYVPVLDANLGAFNIIGSTSGSQVPLGNPGGMLHITGQNGQVSRIYNDSISNYALYVGRRYNGLASAPTGVLINQVVSRLGANPYLTDAAEFTDFGFAKIDFVATENQTTTAQGSKIDLYATPNGENVQTLVASFNSGGIAMGGNIIPTIDNTYTLGNINLRWKGAYFGNAGIYIQDVTTGLTGSLSLNNGILLVDNNISSIRVGNTSLTQQGISTSNAASNIQIGLTGDTGYTYLRNAGLKFADSTIQTTAAIPLSYMGAANGVATLGADSKVTPSQLPAGAVFFKGTWDASTNTPTLVNGTGTAGWEYQCSVAGTVNFGAGPISFLAGDFVIYNGALWQRIPGSGSGVTSFNTRTGVVTLTSGDVTNALTTGSIINDKLQNNAITINSGSGLSGGATVSLGGSVTLTANVRDVIAGTGVTVTPSSGNYTIAIGQPVGTANTVQFVALSTTTTIQATGNITGGNLATGGKIVATGNIETSGNLVTSNTVINSSITSNGNVNFTGANVSLGAVGNVRVTGGTSGQFLTTNGSGTLSWANVTAANITGTIANANYAAYAGNVTIAGQGNITSLGTLTGLTSGGTVNLTTASNVALGSNANVHITGGGAGNVLTTDGTGNLTWSSPTSGNTIILPGNTSPNIDFTLNSTTLIYLPTGPVTINLSNYAAGHTARVIIRFATPYTVTLGVANVQQTTEGALTLPTTGAGGHKINGNQSIQLLYTCFDSTAANCYVATTFL